LDKKCKFFKIIREKKIIEQIFNLELLKSFKDESTIIVTKECCLAMVDELLGKDKLPDPKLVADLIGQSKSTKEFMEQLDVLIKNGKLPILPSPILENKIDIEKEKIEKEKIDKEKLLQQEKIKQKQITEKLVKENSSGFCKKMLRLIIFILILLMIGAFAYVMISSRKPISEPSSPPFQQKYGYVPLHESDVIAEHQDTIEVLNIYSEKSKLEEIENERKELQEKLKKLHALEKLEQDKLEKEKLERKKIETERLEKLKFNKENLEKERIENEKLQEKLQKTGET